MPCHQHHERFRGVGLDRGEEGEEAPNPSQLLDQLVVRLLKVRDEAILREHQADAHPKDGHGGNVHPPRLWDGGNVIPRDLHGNAGVQELGVQGAECDGNDEGNGVQDVLVL